jgi:hypothetical protein
MLNVVLATALVCLGLLTIIASVRNWQVLFDDGKPVHSLSRAAARIVYGALGAIITTAGLVGMLRPLV